MISIIIPTNSPDLECWPAVTSCLAQSYEKSRFEVLIVTNFPNKSLAMKVAQVQLDNLRVLCSHTPGVNPARNLGLDSALGEIVYFLDDDCRLPDPHHLSRLHVAHQTQPEVCAIGSSYKNDAASNYWGDHYNQMVDHWVHSHGQRGQTFLPGGNCSFKKSLLGNLRFDPSITYGGSETEFFVRLHQQKLKVLDIDTLKVFHKSQISLSDVVRKAWKQGRGRSRFNTPKGRFQLQRHSNVSNLIFLAGYKAVVDTGALFDSLRTKN